MNERADSEKIGDLKVLMTKYKNRLVAVKQGIRDLQNEQDLLVGLISDLQDVLR